MGYATKPTEAEVLYPLGHHKPECHLPPPSGQQNQSKKRRKEDASPHPEEGPSKKHSSHHHSSARSTQGENKYFRPHDSANLRKYSTESLKKTKCISRSDILTNLPCSMQNTKWYELLISLNSTAVTQNSWLRYDSAYNNLKKFSSETKTDIS